MRLTQVVTNLIDNACKFSHDGGTVSLIVRRLQGAVALEISDDGIGMDSMTLSNIFEPFAQAAHAPHANRTGLGIGLAIVRRLTELHGGQVVAESRGVGLGSRFVVTLPMSTPVPAPAADPTVLA